MTSISVTAVGAVTSVGYDAATACSSIRAGITRPSLIEEFEVLDMAEQEPIGLTGHPLGEATRGFSGVGRWLQMAAMALRDLASSGSIPETADQVFWSSTICYVVLPFLDPRRFDPTGTHGTEEALRASFVKPLLRRCEPWFAPAETILLPRGRIGSLHAILMAARQLSEGRVRRGLVLAVDSLLDEPALLWLAQSRRLKEDDNPVGLSPGEAAVAFLVEQSDAARRRGALPIANVAAVATAREPNVFMAGERSLGEGIADVVQRALAEADVAMPYRSDVLTDLNGESWRSTEYGNARTRVPSRLWQGHRIAMPASSVGDVGAAMTALELLVACHSLERGYAAGRDVLLMSSDEYGDVGAAVLREEG
jgi:3-oxoacyl-[acyl-carrier-protein] synthase-1